MVSLVARGVSRTVRKENPVGDVRIRREIHTGPQTNEVMFLASRSPTRSPLFSVIVGFFSGD